MVNQTWMNPEIDRSDWGPGPWDGEPDKASWTDEATGLPCLAVRGNPHFGIWCGYVAVEPGHPLHGKSADETELYAHGDVNFSSSCMDDAPVERSVCHVPEPGKSGDVWWFGFDCGHAFDVQPAMLAWMRNADLPSRLLTEDGDPAWPGGPRSSYKTLGYVKAECAELAKQLAEADIR